MGRAIDTVTAQVTNPNTTVTALTANAGDSLTVRSTNTNAPVHLINLWAFSATAGVVRLRSPRMHDFAQNNRFQTVASVPDPLMAFESSNILYSQDVLTLEMSGDAAAVDMVSMLLYYEDITGLSAGLYTPEEIMPLVDQLTTVEVDLTSSGTACNYSATVALNGTFDTLRRNLRYAILGYECGITGGTVGIRGAATGNLRVSGPLYNRTEFTADWFVRLSRYTGMPCIPVFNSADVGNILVDCACQATTTSFKVGVNLALLKS